MPVDLEVMVLGDLRFDRREIASRELDHGAAGTADEVVVMVATAQAIGGLPFVLADHVDQPGVGERDQCAVHRGESELCALPTCTLVHLVCGERPSTLQCVHHRDPLRSAPQTVLSKCETNVHTPIVVLTPRESGDTASPECRMPSAIVQRTGMSLPAPRPTAW